MNIEHEADDKKSGATIAEVYQWLHHLNGLGIDPRTPIKAVVGFRGQLQKIQVKEKKS